MKKQKYRKNGFFPPHPLVPHPSVGIFILLSYVFPLVFSFFSMFLLKFSCSVKSEITNRVCQVSYRDSTFTTQVKYKRADHVQQSCGIICGILIAPVNSTQLYSPMYHIIWLMVCTYIAALNISKVLQSTLKCVSNSSIHTPKVVELPYKGPLGAI